ncbi:tape measure protein [Pediococcus acidilactici]
MASKVDSVMSTSVALETLKASSSINSLTKAVRSSTSAWKAQEAQLKSSGDYLKASEAKYEGLGKSIEAERKRIEVLQDKMKDLDQTTQDGARQAVKYGTDLDKATAALKSMEAQQQRAYEALQREKSGINSLNSSMRQRNSLSKAISDRLEAEGKHEEALKEKRDNARKSIDDISKALKKEEALLKDLENNNGSASAINKQRIAVENLKTSMAKTKNEVHGLESQLNKKPTGFLGGIKEKLFGVKKASEEAKHSIKGIAIGSAIGNSISNGFSRAIGYIKETTKQGYELAEAGATIKKQWNNLGLSDSEATKMIKQIGDIRSKANMSGGAIDQMQKKFYAITNSTSKARDMTEVLASYGSAAGKSGDQIASLAQGVSQLSGSSKVAARLFKRTFSQVPELQKAIIKASGMSTDAFNKQLATGKITGSQLQGYMVKAAKTSGKAWEEFGDTTKGKMAAIQGTYTNLKVAFAKPLVSGIEKAIDGISEKKGALDHVKKSLSDLVGALGKRTGQYVGDVISFLVKNEKSIEKTGGAFASIVGSLAKGAWSAVASALKLIGGRSKDASTGMNGVAAATAAIAKHKGAIETLGKAIMVYLAASKLKTIGSTISGVAGGIGKVIGTMTRLVKSEKLATAAQWLFNAAMDANPIGIAVVAIGALTAGLVLAYKHIKPFRDAVNKAFKSVASFGKGIAKWGSNVGKSIGQALGSVGKKWNGFKKSFGKSWNSHWSAMGKSLRNSWNGSVKNTRNFFSTVGNKWNGFKNGFRKSWNSHWNTMTSNLHSAWNSSYKHTRDFFSGMGTKWAGWKKSWSHSWNNHWDTMRSNLHSYWNKDLSHTKVFGKSMGDWLGGFKKAFSGGWSSLGTGVENIFRGLWNNLKGLASDGMNAIIDLINGGINAVDSVIHAFGGKKKTIADLGHVHFATGTGVFSGSRNPITRPTMAVLNDGNDSPQTGNKEMVVLPNGDSGIVQGRNTKMMLPAGTEVLSASETAMLMSMQGVTKYAKGTGFFSDILNSVTNGISGVTNWVGKKVGSLEKFFKTATNIIAHPIKSLENLFSWSSKGISGVMSNIGHGLFNGVEKQAKTWWSTLWSMVDLNGGGSYGGGWQSPGSGWTHTDGFGSPRGGGVHDGNDFSARVGTPFHAMHGGTVIRVGNPPAGWGAVGYNIVTRDSTGKEIIYQEFGNAKDVRVHQGQHVKTGDILGVLGHSGLGTGPHLHVGLTNGGSVWGRNGMSTAGWLDITKQHGKDKGSDADSDTNNSLQKIIKNQVGGGFWKFISKLADMFGDNGSSDPGGSGVQRWRSKVRNALSELGLSTSASMVNRVLRQINTESGGNPKAMGGTDGLADGHAEGLMQVKPGTFSAYHLPGHNNIWNGYDNILAGLNYAKHRYGSGLSFLGNGHGYANGGIATTPSIFGEAGPEMAIPLSMTRSDRANQLLGETVVHMAKNNPDRITDNNTTYSSHELITKLDKLTKLAGNMVELLQEQILATRDSAFNKDALYRAQALDQNVADFQSF